MSVHVGPNIKRDNLLAEWDALNINSYSNNRFSIQGNAIEGMQGNYIPSTFPLGGNILTRMGYNQIIGGYTIKSSDVVYRFDLTQGGCLYSGNTDYIQSGTYITFTCDWYVTEDANNWGLYGGGVLGIENYGGIGTGGYFAVPNTLKGVWQTMSYTVGPTTGNGTGAFFLYPGLCSGKKMADAGFLYYRNPQVVYSSSAPISSYNAKPDSMVWYDTSGNNYHMTKTNVLGFGGPVVWRSPGYFDFSVNTPSTAANAWAGNGFGISNMIVPTTGSFSITVHGKRDYSQTPNGDRETVFSNAGGADGWRFGPFQSSGIYYLLGDNKTFYQEGNIGSTNTADNKWHTITIVYDRDAMLGSYTIYTYVDGQFSGSTTINAGSSQSTAPFPTSLPGIGIYGCCDPFAGQMSYLAVHKTALSASDIKSMHSTLGGRFSV